jgi:hypothetical protein
MPVTIRESGWAAQDVCDWPDLGDGDEACNPGAPASYLPPTAGHLCVTDLDHWIDLCA